MPIASDVLQNYKSIMYRETANSLLTGDVICLKLTDFEKFVRHPSMLEIFRQFDGDSKYRSQLWAVLNKPCDMVHDDKGRRFKNNLFLAPLLGFKTALNTGVLGFYPHHRKGPNAYKAFIDAYKKYLKEQAFAQNPRPAEENRETYNRRIDTEIVSPILNALEEKVVDLKNESGHPDEILLTLKDKTSPGSAPHSSLLDFEKSTSWTRTKQRFETQSAEAAKMNSKIVLPKDKAITKELTSLCLNQMDSAGIFFYEPDPRFSVPEDDLAYLIQLENLLTVKVKPTMIEKGEFVEILLENRRISLEENFSDRLLNIMGNFFSKIGTDDVLLDDILETYVKTYPGEFIFGVDEAQSQAAAEAEAATNP